MTELFETYWNKRIEREKKLFAEKSWFNRLLYKPLLLKDPEDIDLKHLKSFCELFFVYGRLAEQQEIINLLRKYGVDTVKEDEDG